MTTKKQKRIGKKVGNLVAIMLVVAMVVVSFLGIAMSYQITLRMLRDKCVSGTNVLSFALQTGGLPEDMNAFLDELKVRQGCEFTIFEGDVRAYTTITQNGQRMLGTTLSPDIADIVLKKGQSYVGESDILGVAHLCSYVPTLDANGQIDGLIFAGISKSSVMDQVYLTILLSCVVGLVMMVIFVLILTWYLKNVVSRPLASLTQLAQTMDQGELGLQSRRSMTVDIHSDDEIGILAQSFGSTIQRLRGYIGEISDVLEAVAGGDLTVTTRQNYIGDFTSIKVSMEAIIAKLGETMAQIVSSAEQVSAGADQMSSGAQALSQGAMEQASTLEGLKETIDSISVHIKGTASNAQEANNQSNTVNGQVQESNQKMQEMISAMEEINASSSEIGKIIKAIEDIAFQTNILALNAAVEAARAGAAGKGFAVVADEVRNLASKSADASKSTSALIESSLAAVEKGTRIANETAAQLDRVVVGAGEVMTSINAIAAASQEQAEAVAQVQTQIGEISDVVTTNSATAEESAATSEELSAQARMLEEMTSSFRLR